jgi:pyruvate-formate lyase
MTDARGVDYQFSSTNILGIPNVADSLFAIQKLVFEQKRYTLEEVRERSARIGRQRAHAPALPEPG